MLQLWLVTRYQLLLLTDTLTAKMMCYIKLSSALWISRQHHYYCGNVRASKRSTQRKRKDML